MIEKLRTKSVDIHKIILLFSFFLCSFGSVELYYSILQFSSKIVRNVLCIWKSSLPNIWLVRSQLEKVRLVEIEKLDMNWEIANVAI